MRVRNLIGMVKVNRAQRRKAKSKKGGKYRGLKRPTDDGVANGGKKRYGWKGVILAKVELSIRDQLQILSYRGSDKDILDIQKEVKKDWLNYLLEKG